MTETPFVDSSFAVPVFSPGDDPIACLNKAMAFLMVVASSRFPTTNNQLRTSSNLRNQATIQDGRVTVQQVQGRQGQNYSGTTYKNNATNSRGNTTTRQARVEVGQILDEEQPAFLADPGIPTSQAPTIIPHNAAFQTEDLDTYDSDCDDLSNQHFNYVQTSYSSGTTSETYLNDLVNQVGFNLLVHSFRALSTLRRSGLRTASAAAKPCQGDSSEVYLITGRIPTVAAAGQRHVNSQPHAHTSYF
ncbi:hypothetical protein Tco_1556114 [Tanacetum coccineum]